MFIKISYHFLDLEYLGFDLKITSISYFRTTQQNNLKNMHTVLQKLQQHEL